MNLCFYIKWLDCQKIKNILCILNILLMSLNMKLYIETRAKERRGFAWLYLPALVFTEPWFIQLVAELIRCEFQADSYSSLRITKLYQSPWYKSDFTLLFIFSHTFLPQGKVFITSLRILIAVNYKASSSAYLSKHLLRSLG